MKRKLLIVVGVALVAATVSTVVFYQLISGSISGEEARVSQEFPVVTAARDLPRGTRLNPVDLSVTTWAGEKAPEGAYATAAELAGRMVDRDVRQGEPVFESGLAGPGKAVGAGAIPPGMRAVSIHLAEYAGVARLLENGDRVDVLAADSDRRPGNVDARLHTVLQGVQVLDAGKDEEPGTRRSGAAPVVTILIEAKDAETLSLADQAGSIRLSLRNPLDSTTEETAGAGWQDVAGNRPKSGNRGRSARSATTISQARPAVPSQANPEAPKDELAAMMPDLHSRLGGPGASGDKASEAASVMLSVTFAGLGDEALSELTAGLAERYTVAPMILSAFRPGWDVEKRMQTLVGKSQVEVFASPTLLAIDRSEAQFARNSDASGGKTIASTQTRENAGNCLDRVGMRVTFLPTIGEQNRLRIRVTSEVAVPEPSQTPTPGGCAAPLAMREWSGEIELADGQSFWVRGLIDRPGAWDFVRRLFPQRPLKYDRNDELAILVTPKLVAAEKTGKPLSAALPR
jgi:pilus assembly protein CpaB